MTPAEFHKVCHDAILKCPQVNGYKINDTLYPSYEKFWDLPKRGWAAVIRFWEKDDTLWRSGYHEYLPKEAKEIFRKASKVSCEACSQICDSYAKADHANYADSCAEEIRARGVA